MKPKRHLSQEQRRVYRNVKMEMKSLDQRMKSLPKDFSDKEARKREEKKLQSRERELEQKLRDNDII